MADRWVLERAGITNVYQYGEEILSFGGGRLLLRGVNGSGKSTAMNMLLPFLLEARTARIDAAGEQTGVLASWMLTGRSEPQPVGYLWIEFAREADHLTVGCGIKANASTGRVTTWWFITGRRPGIDLALVEGRQPLGSEALREQLEPGAVFAEKDRPAYRAEVARRLFGGADLDQHLRLLHVVRSPRVGDRIDLDLPRYLTDALPQLSEEALDDAAQPLEDLEEHRHNVEELRRTSTALEAIAALYRSYVRHELHQRARAADTLVRAGQRAAREEAATESDHRGASAEQVDATRAVADGEQAERRLDGEIRDLESSDAYRAGTELNDLRDHVATLDRQVTEAKATLADRQAATTRARTAIGRARQEGEDAQAALREALTEVSASSAEAGLPARPPDAPGLDLGPTVQRTSAGSAPGETTEGEVPLVPAGELDADALVARIGQVRAGARQREADVVVVRRAMSATDEADDRRRQTASRLGDATDDADTAEAAFVAARHRIDETAAGWRADVDAWARRMDAHIVSHGIEEVSAADEVREADVVGHHDVITEGANRRAQAVVDHHARRLAEQQAARRRRSEELVDAEAVLAELLGRGLPDPPAASWQRPERGRCVADLVDFRDDVGAEDRTGLEAAMVASGLLGAEVDTEGVTDPVVGELQARAGTGAGRSLADLLTVTVPEELAGEVNASSITAVLASISIEPGDLDADDDRTVVTVDGRFRTGVLRGRHEVAVAEHIGVTARRSTLERQRTEAARAVAIVEALLDQLDQAIVATERAAAEAAELRAGFPPTTPLVRAIAGGDQAEETLAVARQRLADRRQELTEVERIHGEALDALRRQSATLGLPHDRLTLDEVASAIARLAGGCTLAERGVAALAQAVARWRTSGDDWSEAAAQARVSAASLRAKQGAAEVQRSRLGTLEDSIGLEYRQVVEAIETSRRGLTLARTVLAASRQRFTAAARAVATAEERRRQAVEAHRAAEARCVAELPVLRAALAVPGLLAAVGGGAVEAVRSEDETSGADTQGPELPVVAETVEGVAELAAAVTRLVGPPDPAPTTADGVRQSLRQRRDALGAGWDAEDHQPTDTLPLHVEVNGPEGRMALPDAAARVTIQLGRMSGLLSAKQDQALRNLLQGLVAKEVAEKLHAAAELIARMNARLDTITTSHGIGVSLRWKRRSELDAELDATIDLLAKLPDLRSAEEDRLLTEALSARIATARVEQPEQPYRDLIAHVLDYRGWHEMALILARPGRGPERLTRRTALSEGEKKMTSYLPLFAAVAASCDALADRAADSPRFVLLDDAFAKVSEDNHAKLFGLLVELDLDFIATSERLWGTHATVPELAITEVIRDADLGAIVLEHSRWNGVERAPA